MEIRNGTYIDANRAREAGITEEMIRDKISNFCNFGFDEPVWWVDSDLDLRSYYGRLKDYIKQYASEDKDVTDEFIEWLKPYKKEFDVYSRWGLLPEDIDTTKVAKWLEDNTALKYPGGDCPTTKSNRWQHLTCGDDFRGGYLLYSEKPLYSTPGALAFFKEKLSVKTGQGVILTLNMLRELEGGSSGFNVEEIRKAGFNIDYLLLPENIDMTHSNYTHYKWYFDDEPDLMPSVGGLTDYTAEIIAKYGKTPLAEKPIKQENRRVDFLNTDLNLQRDYTGEGIDSKQKHKAFNKYFK